MSNSESYVIYKGPSMIDGKPIVCIAQIGTRNRKTGDMVQTYIIRSDIDPVTASRTGEDKSICGDCMHKGKPHDGDKGQAKERTCYVTLAHGPLMKYKGFTKGLYTPVLGHKRIASLGQSKFIRIGTYGDPAAVPNYIWDSLLAYAKGWTAYTHNPVNPDPKRFMTSADTLAQAKEAWNRGERTFRVIPNAESKVSDEVLCPASAEMGHRTTCDKCRLCNGGKSIAKSIAIVAHGNSAGKLKEMI